MISYERYAELLFQQMDRTLGTSEQEDLAAAEAAQLKTCLQRGTAAWSTFAPSRMAHEVDKGQIQP